MFRSNLLYKFFRYKKINSHKIVKYNSNKEFDFYTQKNNQMIEIDQKISEVSKALLEAQITKLRSTFSNSNNLIENIGKNIYKTRLEESIIWHQKELKELYTKRRELQIFFEKMQGIYWLNRIKRFLAIILIGVLSLLSLFIFLSGFMIIVYLLPLIILIFFVYLLASKK